MASQDAAPTQSRPATASASATDDYSDLASLPTPNKDKFPNDVPGEYMVLGNMPKEALEGLISCVEGGRTNKSTPHGIIFEAKSRRLKEEQRQEEEAEDDYIPAGGFAPKISVEGRRTASFRCTENFVCDGTLYRHTAVSWKDAPIEFKHQHRVDATEDAPAKSIRYEHKIEDLTPFDCEVYWQTISEKCESCHEADQEFARWAVRASKPGAIAASKKRKAEEVMAAKEAEGQGKPKARRGNLNSE